MMKKIILFSIFIIISFSCFSQWSNDPQENTVIAQMGGEEVIPKIATSETGISYISWFSSENGNYNVRLQKLDVYGNKLWGEGGFLVSDHPSMSWLTDWDLCVDHSDHAIITFQDIRNSGNNNIYAYRISPEGEFIWGDDGLELSNSTAFDVSPKVKVTAINNTIISWQSDDVVYIQKISPEGNLLFGDSGITLSSENTLSWPQILPVGDDDFILKYFDDSGPVYAVTRIVYAQRFDSNGDPVWPQETIVSDAAGISSWTQIFPFINDGNDGFYMAWHDDRDLNMLSSVFVQHIGSDGSVLYNDDGVEASIMPARNHFYPGLALPPGTDEVFVFWNEMDGDQNARGIYGQKLSSTGERLWSDNGKVFIELSSTDVFPSAARNSEEDMMVVYEEAYGGNNYGIKAMRIDLDGNYLWEDEIVNLSSVQSAKGHAEVNSFFNDQWIAVWSDDRNGQNDIYGQNIQIDGSLGPVVISEELDIYPDTVYCDIIGPHFVYIVNNTEEEVLIEDIYFDIGYFDFEGPDNLLPGESLILEIYIELPISNIDDYFLDYLNIVTSSDDYQVVFYINDLLFSIPNSSKLIDYKVAPNPFSEEVTFNVKYKGQENVEIFIYSANGQLVRNNYCSEAVNGSYTIVWDGKNNSGNFVGEGLYIYCIKADNLNVRGKVILKN